MTLLHHAGPIQSGGGFIGGMAAPGGRTFYVNEGTGTDVRDKERPWYTVDNEVVFSTLQGAIDACEENRGDVIYVARTAITVTTPVLFNVRGISVIAQGWGMNPMVQGEFFAIVADSSYTDGPVGIISKGCRIYGMGFASRDTGATFFSGAALLIGGASGSGAPFGVHLDHCRFPKFNFSNRIGLAIAGGDAVTSVLVEYCDFEGVGTDFESGIYAQGAIQNLVYRYNHFRDCDYAMRFGAIAGGGPNAIIGPENITQGEDSKAVFTNAGAGEAIICGNYWSTAVGTGSYDLSGADLQTANWRLAGNHYTNEAEGP